MPRDPGPRAKVFFEPLQLLAAIRIENGKFLRAYRRQQGVSWMPSQSRRQYQLFEKDMRRGYIAASSEHDLVLVWERDPQTVGAEAGVAIRNCGVHDLPSARGQIDHSAVVAGVVIVDEPVFLDAERDRADIHVDMGLILPDFAPGRPAAPLEQVDLADAISRGEPAAGGTPADG